MHEEFVIRPVQENDYEAIMALAKTAAPGLTNLLADEKLIRAKIQWSLESFEKKLIKPERELYFFVLENTQSKEICGTCGIFSAVGDEFYSFKVFREVVSSERLGLKQEHHYLQLVNDYKDVSEIGLLLINRKLRKMGLGKFLSRSRYLFMADNLEKFHPHLIAEMRGRSDLLGRSIFWNAIGKRFVNIRFMEADYLSASNQKHFISELFPHTPIPVTLLSPSAQAVIGAPHKDTAAAVTVLLGEGFEYSNYVDVFDGGPYLETVLKHVKTVAQSQCAVVSGTNATGGVSCMASYQADQYRVGIGSIICHEGGAVEISSKLAQNLACSVNDKIRYIIL